LLANVDVRSRVADLRREIKTSYIHLQITERDERLKAAQERWDGMREVIQARKTGDYSRALKTGLLVRRERVIGTGKNAKLIEEYEVDTALLDAMASLEKQVAIETGQWTEKQDVDLHGQISAKSIALSKVMSLEELEALEAKMLAAMAQDGQQPKAIASPNSGQNSKAPGSGGGHGDVKPLG
jgi:hypothetical protein